nr:probable pre-mRNA-splicing factor ATP-dependent RNA helicase DEAH9 [Tanacetum cinerariifolium]
MSSHGIPEMQRSNLASSVIQGYHLFDWPSSPSPEATVRAFEVLYSLGVIDDDAKLTSPVGFQVAELLLFIDKAKLQEIGTDLKVRSESLKLSMDVLERTRKEQLEKHYPNLIFTQGLRHTLRGSPEVYIHPSSVLFRVNPIWIIYHSLVSTDRQYMRNVISIDPSWLREAAPHFYHQQPFNPNRH